MLPRSLGERVNYFFKLIIEINFQQNPRIISIGIETINHKSKPGVSISKDSVVCGTGY